MRTIHRLALMTFVVMGIGVSAAQAAPINVAEFRWDTILDGGAGCDAADPSCVPVDPVVLSIFSLTNIWDGRDPAATLFENRLSLPTGDLTFFDLQPVFPFHFDQLAVEGIPEFAAASVSFLFGGQAISLSATLTQPDTFAVLQFDPPASVPEPGTVVLVGTGLTFALARRIRRRRQTTSR